MDLVIANVCESETPSDLALYLGNRVSDEIIAIALLEYH